MKNNYSHFYSGKSNPNYSLRRESSLPIYNKKNSYIKETNNSSYNQRYNPLGPKINNNLDNEGKDNNRNYLSFQWNNNNRVLPYIPNLYSSLNSPSQNNVFSKQFRFS